MSWVTLKPCIICDGTICWFQVNILTSIDQMGEFEQGQVLVADMTDPDWEPIMSLGDSSYPGKSVESLSSASETLKMFEVDARVSINVQFRVDKNLDLLFNPLPRRIGTRIPRYHSANIQLGNPRWNFPLIE